MPAVNAIANTPQKVTRNTALPIGAPPVDADRPPSSAKHTKDVTETISTTMFGGQRNAASKGNAAPNANVLAEVKAACTGRADMTSEIPNSSRA